MDVLKLKLENEKAGLDFGTYSSCFQQKHQADLYCVSIGHLLYENVTVKHQQMAEWRILKTQHSNLSKEK